MNSKEKKYLFWIPPPPIKKRKIFTVSCDFQQPYAKISQNSCIIMHNKSSNHKRLRRIEPYANRTPKWCRNEQI